MSSGFVSAGTNEVPVERDDEWLKAQNDIEENRRRRAEESRQQGGKSLYETLQANKAAKQEAFEESIRLKNQFRSLDEDEVEFLDSVLESTRAQEAAIKKETSEQLEIFRKQQEEADKALLNAEDSQEKPAIQKSNESEEKWAIGGRKRKKGRQDDFKALKLRKTSSADSDLIQSSTLSTSTSLTRSKVSKDNATRKNSSPLDTSSTINGSNEKMSPSSPDARASSNLLGLGNYDSEDDN